MIDYGPQDIEIVSPANASVHNANVIIEGNSYDGNGVNSVDISIDGGTLTQVTDASAAGEEPFTSWEYDYIVDSGGSTDGVHTYQVIATDLSGATTAQDRQFVVDTTKPTVNFVLPNEGQTVNGTAVEIRGTADDNRSIKGIYIWVGSEGTIPPDPETDIASWTQLSGTFSWTYALDSTQKPDGTPRPDGNYDIHIVAEDGVGNFSLDNNRNIVIEQNSNRPNITLSNIDPTAEPNNNAIGVEKNISGTIEDDDGVDSSTIEISIDGGNWQSVTNQPDNDKTFVSWSHDLTGINEGQHTAQIRVADIQYSGTVPTSDYYRGNSYGYLDCSI